MCDICKARDFYNNPAHQASVNMIFNGHDLKDTTMKDFAFAILYREGMKVALNAKEAATCDEHKMLLSMVATFAKV